MFGKQPVTLDVTVDRLLALDKGMQVKEKSLILYLGWFCFCSFYLFWASMSLALQTFCISFSYSSVFCLFTFYEVYSFLKFYSDTVGGVELSVICL